MRVLNGGRVFRAFFVLYVGGLALWLVMGLAPSVVHEIPSLHEALHDRADDALRARAEVVVELETDEWSSQDLVIRDDEARPVFRGRTVERGETFRYRFTAPPPGSYQLSSSGDPELRGEIRFTEDGADRLRLRASGENVETVDGDRWAHVAQRLAAASHRVDHPGRVTLETLFSLLNLGLGVLIVSRRPGDRAARLLAVGMIGTAATFNHQSHSVLEWNLVGDLWALHELFHLGSGLAYMYAVVVFPDGRLVPEPRPGSSRFGVRLLYGVLTVVVAGAVLGGAFASHPGQGLFTVLFGVLIPVVGVAAQTWRLRRAPDAEARQQSQLLRWALFPMLVAGLVYLVLNAAGVEAERVALAVFPSLFVLIPAALLVGILRYRLWDIDVLISRTLLSVGLAGFIAAVYVAVVVVLGDVLGAGVPVAQIATTGIVAIAFEPVRERLERLANRLVYGERATPYEVMADLAARVSNAISVDDVLPRVAEAVALGVGASASRVTVRLPGGGTPAVAWPAGSTALQFTRVLPVAYRGQPIGEIAVSKPPPERLSSDEEGLLDALAAQAGLAFNNVRLTIELQSRLTDLSARASELRASRQRIVTAREGQRQRVVQIIQDRVEAPLLEAAATVGGVDGHVVNDPEAAVAALDEAAVLAGEAIESLRDLARGVFPPLLADRGVLVALEAHVRTVGLAAEVEALGLPAGQRFDPQAEASVFFCVTGALSNVAKYAPGSAVCIRLTAGDGRLAFQVSDDGPGAELRVLSEGPDLLDMRDRVEAVGGELELSSSPGRGTMVAGWVPAQQLTEPRRRAPSSS